MTQAAVIVAALLLSASCPTRGPESQPEPQLELEPDLQPEPEPEPCFVPVGPPCLHISDPRLADCKLSVGSCFFVEWDEITGDVVITHAALVIHPTCKDESSSARLEQAGRDHLASLQSVSIEISVTVEPCEIEGYMDLTIR